MQSKAATVDAYLKSLPADRRDALVAVRNVFREHLDPDIAEGMQYGMIGYFIPHSVFPPGYHCDPKQPLPFAGLASQKQHLSLYLMCLYFDGPMLKSFQADYAKSGKKLDMGKSCIRFKKLDDLHLPAIIKVLKTVTAKKYIAHYQANLDSSARRKPAPKTTKKAAKSAK